MAVVMELEVSLFEVREEAAGDVVLVGIVGLAVRTPSISAVSLPLADGVVVLISPGVPLVDWVVVALVVVVVAIVVITAGEVVLVPVITVLT